MLIKEVSMIGKAKFVFKMIKDIASVKPFLTLGEIASRYPAEEPKIINTESDVRLLDMVLAPEHRSAGISLREDEDFTYLYRFGKVVATWHSKLVTMEQIYQAADEAVENAEIAKSMEMDRRLDAHRYAQEQHQEFVIVCKGGK